MRRKGSKSKPLMTGVYLYVPATFDASSFSELAGFENAAHWLLHKIITSGHKYKHNAKFDGFAHISRQTMKQFIQPAHISIVRNTLISQGVIVCNESYRISEPGIEGYSQAYALTPEYAGELRRVEVTSRKLAARICANRIQVRNRAIDKRELEPTLLYLKDCLREVKIDIDAALTINDTQSDEPIIARRKVGKMGRKRFVRAAYPSVKAISRMTIETIASGEWDFNPCQYGRVHHPITRLPTEMRQTLSIGGQPLAMTDIRNSQLVFFTILLLEERYISASASYGCHVGSDGTSSPDGSGLDLRDVGEETELHPLRGINYDSHLDIESSDQKTRNKRTQTMHHPFLTDDEIAFRDAVLNGTIYDQLMKATNYTDRQIFKGAFFEAVLYGDNKRSYSIHSPITREFRRCFPNVWQFILKRKEWTGKGDPKEAFKQLARDMQLAESRYMIGHVCGRMEKHHKHVKIITIHDSIMAAPEHLPLIKRIMQEEFARYGVRPTLADYPARRAARFKLRELIPCRHRFTS